MSAGLSISEPKQKGSFFPSRLLVLAVSLVVALLSFGIASTDAFAWPLIDPYTDRIDREVANRDFTALGSRTDLNIEVLYRTSSGASRRAAQQVLDSLETAMAIVVRLYPGRLEGGGHNGIHQLFVEDPRLMSVHGVNEAYHDDPNGPTASVVRTGNYSRRGSDLSTLIHELSHAGQMSAIGSGRIWPAAWLAEGLAVFVEHNFWTSSGLRPSAAREREIANYDSAFLNHPEVAMNGRTSDLYNYGAFRFFVWLERELGAAFAPAIQATFRGLHDARISRNELSDIYALSDGLRAQGQDLGTLLARFRLEQYDQNVAVQRAVGRNPSAFTELRNGSPVQLSANLWGARIYRFTVPAGSRNVHVAMEALRPGGRLWISNGGQMENWTTRSGDAGFRFGTGFSPETVRTIPAVAGTELIFVYVNAGISRTPMTSSFTVSASSDDPDELARRFTLFNLLRRASAETGTGSSSGSTEHSEDVPGRTGVRIDPGVHDVPAEAPPEGDRVRIDVPPEQHEDDAEPDDLPTRRPNRGRQTRENRRVAELPLCPGAFANSALADLPMIPVPQYNPRATAAWVQWAARNPQGAHGTVNEYNFSTPRPPVNRAWDAAWERTLFALRDNDWVPGLNGYLRTLDGRAIVDHNWEPVRAEYIQAADGNYYYTGRLVTARGEPREQIRDGGDRTHQSGDLLDLRVYETRLQRQFNEFQRRLNRGIRNLLPAAPNGNNPSPRIVPFWPWMRLLVDNADSEICPTQSCPRTAASTTPSSYRQDNFRQLIGGIKVRISQYSCNPPACPPDSKHLPPERWEQLNNEPEIRDYYGKDGYYLSYCLSQRDVLGDPPCGTFAWDHDNHVWEYGVRGGSNGSYDGTC